MSALVNANRRAATGLATVLLATGLVAGAMAVTVPTFTSGLSASAAELVTGQTTIANVVLDTASASAGVFN